MVFYGIKWKMNPKFLKIDLNEWNLVIFEWNLNGIYEIRGIDVVWSLDSQLFEWYTNLVEIEVSIVDEISEIFTSKSNEFWSITDLDGVYCWWKFWGFWIWNESILALPASPLLCLSSPLSILASASPHLTSVYLRLCLTSPHLCLSSPLAKISEDNCWWKFWINV